MFIKRAAGWHCWLVQQCFPAVGQCRLVGVLVRDDQDNVVRRAEFTYDAFDRLLVRWVDEDGDGAGQARETLTLYDTSGRSDYGRPLDDVLAEFGRDEGGAWSLTSRYLYGPAVDQLLAVWENASGLPLGAASESWPADAAAAFYLADHLGSVRQVVDGSTGQVINEVVYDNFGNLLSQSGADGGRFRWTGREWFDSLGLQYNRARWYDPAIGRWLSEDPIADDLQNLYRYVGNGPLNGTDPSGQSILGKAIKESVEKGSEAGIKQAIRAEIRKNFYDVFSGILNKYGVRELYQIHHLFCQTFFDNPKLGPWLEKLGFYRDAARNLVALPTKEAVRQGATRSAKAAIHEGGHLGEYYQRVQKTLMDIMERHTTGKLTDEAARLELRQAQAELRSGLKDGSIKLHNYDKAVSREELRAKLTTAFGLAVFAGMNDAEAEEAVMGMADRYLENERYYRQKNVLVRYGTAGYYTANSQSEIARWAAFAVDFFNPVDDVIFVTDLAEDMVRLGINKYQEFDAVVKGIANDIGRSMRTMQDRNSNVNLRREMLRGPNGKP